MQFLSLFAIAACTLRAATAPVNVEKRQLAGSSPLSSLSSLGIPSFSNPLSSLGGGGGGGASSGISGLQGLSSGLGSGLTPTEGTKRQTTGSSPSLTGGSSSGIGNWGLPSSGLSGLGSLGSGISIPKGSGSSSLGGLQSSTGTSTTGTPDTGASGNASSDGCRALTLLFARGTGELGTMGTVVGPPLAKALANALGEDKVTATGVEYAADAGGNANLGASGGPAMASQAKAALSSCPDTKLVLGGYSQGAMVVHNALSAQGLDASKVAAVVAFGDPLRSQAFAGVDASKVKNFCGSADFLCSAGGGTTSSGSHLDYSGDAEAAAKFIVGVVGL